MLYNVLQQTFHFSQTKNYLYLRTKQSSKYIVHIVCVNVVEKDIFTMILRAQLIIKCTVSHKLERTTQLLLISQIMKIDE